MNEAKAKLGEILRQVKQGRRVVISERGHDVARIVPIEPMQSLDNRLIAPEKRVIAMGLPSRSLATEMRAALAESALRGADLRHVACALFVAEGARTRVAFLTRDRSQPCVATCLGFAAP